MHVLIVESDAALGLFLQKGLRLDGHEVELIGDGETAIVMLKQRKPDLMVMELFLPGRDGTAVLESLAGNFGNMSVLVLTTSDRVEDRAKCLALGAEDYMTKPFSFSELRARCRALIRRRLHEQTLHHSGIEINVTKRSVTLNGLAIDLTVKEFALLTYLMQRKGLCCTREELLREVWQMSPSSGTNVVDVYINYLRRKLSLGYPDPERAPVIIETERGAGYRLGGQASTAKVGAAPLAAIDHVIALCNGAMPDAAVEREIRELEALRSAIHGNWPLSADQKSKIDLGAFAAKNIADWNPKLADAMMHLDYLLQHDGAKVEAVQSLPAGSSLGSPYFATSQ